MIIFQRNYSPALLKFLDLGQVTSVRIGFNRSVQTKEGPDLHFNSAYLFIGLTLLFLSGCTAQQIDKMLDKIPDNNGSVYDGGSSNGPVHGGESTGQNGPVHSDDYIPPPVIVDQRTPRPYRPTCASHVQGKIAWNYKGNKKWAGNNINRLCKGAKYSAEPSRCFNRAMHGGTSWGRSKKWEWKNAIDLCEGSKNANTTINCFERNIRNRRSWQQAIRTCSKSAIAGTPPLYRPTCASHVQGKIAWDYKGNKKWAGNNINRLCKGAEYSAEPARCFKRVMHGGINWGSNTRWKWDNTINLCEGSTNADATIGCFQRYIRSGRSWQQAIRACSK